MARNTRGLVVLAGAGSAALLVAALGFQVLGGLAPCALCAWQRWPHVASAALAGLGLRIGGPLIPALGAVSAAASAGLGVIHTGVERGLWAGVSACSGAPDLSALSAEGALAAIMAAEVVAGDEVAWAMAGLSMASWNALLSTGIAALWALAAHRRRASAR